MISSLRGTVLSAAGSLVVLDVNGVGFSVFVTPDHALTLRVGDDARLHTTLIVRDDSLTLFGFADTERLELFGLLTGVTGVGPKSALGVLAAMAPSEIAAAVRDDNDGLFRKVSGIGPKTAKLIVVSLSGKLDAFAASSAAHAPALVANADVVAALVGLGWSERSAEEAVTEVRERHPALDPLDTAAALRLALASLGTPKNSRGRA